MGKKPKTASQSKPKRSTRASASQPTGPAPERVIFDLPRPVEASHECLPHAAMSLGTPASTPQTVKRLVIEKTGRVWTFYRFDEGGGFVGDSTHPTREDALHQAQREFGVKLENAR